MLVDMSLSDDEKLDMSMPIAMPDAPEYPPGLHICLTEVELAKLGLDVKEAVVGGMCTFEIVAKVTSVSCNDTSDGQCCRVELQIIGMEPDADDAEPDITPVPVSAAPKGFYKPKGA